MILAPAAPDYCASIIRGMWPVVSDDASGDPEDFEPIDHPDAHYLVPMRDGDMGGVIMLARQSSAVVEIHASLLRAFVVPQQPPCLALCGLISRRPSPRPPGFVRGFLRATVRPWWVFGGLDSPSAGKNRKPSARTALCMTFTFLE